LIKETVMGLTKLHVLTSSTDTASTTSYEYFRNELIKRSENDPLRRSKTQPLTAEIDLVDRLALGYGYDFTDGVRPPNEKKRSKRSAFFMSRVSS
jgi:hypothetical protein